MISTIHNLPPTDTNYRDDLKAHIESMPAARLLSVRVVGFARSGLSVIEIEIDRVHTFDGRSVQAGVIGSLADYAGVSASLAALGDGWVGTTTGYEIHNLHPANGSKLIAVGQSLAASRSRGVATVSLFVSDAVGGLKLVAHATTHCKPFQLSAGA